MVRAAFGVILVGGALLLAACTEQPRPDESLARARDLLARGDPAAAEVAVKEALQAEPELAEGRWMLARIHLRQGNPASAEKELRRAAQLGWPADDVRPALARTLLALDRLDDVAALDTSTLSPSAAARVIARQAAARLRRGDLNDASRLVARARALDPASADARLVEAEILSLEGDLEQATKAVGAVLQEDGQNAEAWRVMGLTLLLRDKLSAAEIALDRAIQHGDIAIDARLQRALLNLEQGEIEAAEADARELLRMASLNPASNYIQGLLYFRQGRYTEAITYLTQARSISVQFPVVLHHLSVAHFMENNGDEALRYAQQFHERSPHDVRGLKLLAALELEGGNPGAALTLLQPVADYDPHDPETLRLLANAHFQEGRAARSLSLHMKGRRLRARGDHPPPPPYIERALRNVAEDDLLRIVEHLHEGDFDGALSVAHNYQLEAPTEAAPLHVLARLHIMAGRRDEARRELARALQRDPADATSYLMLAALALFEGDQEDARELYLKALENDGDNLPALLQMARLEGERGDASMGRIYLQRAVRLHPEALEPRLWLAFYYLRSDRSEEVPALLEPLSPLQRGSPRIQAIETAAKLLSNDELPADATLAALLQTHPGSEKYFQLLARAALETGREAAIEQDLRRIIAANPHHAGAMLGLLVLAEAAGDAQTINRYLDDLIARARDPDSPYILQLRATAAARRGETDKALRLAERAFESAPGTATLLKLIALQQRTGQPDRAREMLADWIARHPEDIDVRLTLGQTLQVEGDDTGAKRQYRAILELQPEHAVTLNNLAWLLRREQPAKALEYIRRARELQPRHADILDSLAIIEHLNGNLDRALMSIELALRERPRNPSMRYHKAVIPAALGRIEQAVSALEALHTLDFPEKAEARALLQELRG
ncbi:MAG: tetratricopeptide repeat protein [Halioglobus sp.]|nr:tetratricopeptide repeat protein [Halioglobus sp.]